MKMETLPKTYDFKSTEQRLYQWWEDSGFFKPRLDPAQKPFVISMPPPNVTGELHTGHAMFVALEDLLTRYHRMRGEPTLWVPGSDHAGIATQLQVEKLLRDQGTSREAVGREKFVEMAWDWKRKYGGIIYNQLRRLGASCDWERERFTLDDGLSRAVREAFVRLYEKGLIYRGTYLTNWSPGLRTAVSDLEVEYSEETVTLYYFKYPIAGKQGEYIPVATARPETILADTAVAVHPDDDRYRHLIGETCLVPILNRPIPVIHDTYVDREFGTGALKITPGHDPNDYEIGQRHGLPIVNALNQDATMNESAGPYAGLDRFECREKLWADMQAAGLTVKTEQYTTTVPRSQRGGEIIEPMISTQWYIKIKPLAEPALEAVRDGRIQIVPERFTKVYYNWLENIRDWCISRQLWWGHRIPVWYCPDGHMTTGRADPTACGTCGSAQLEQDPDLLDTWFSSALWPFSTLGWPEETPDLKYFYPTSVMETAYDILFFWVARMIMFGLELTGQAPFHTVYLHGLVRDEMGRKMSKTLGNVIDPLGVMDEYGTDSLRFTLLTGSTPGNDMNLSLQRVEANRNFANKIWNAARFVLGNLVAPRVPAEAPEVIQPSLADRWIRARLEQTVTDCNRLFENHQFGQAGALAYEFIWGEYCDWYLETAKLQLASEDPGRAWATARTLVHVLDQSLRLLHPFVPFVTEEIWQNLKRAVQAHGGSLAPDDRWPESLMLAAWPSAEPQAATAAAALSDYALVMDVVRAIRTTRAEYKVKPAQKIAATLVAGAQTELLESQRDLIAALAGLNPAQFHIHETLREKPREAASQVIGSVECYLPLKGLVDIEAEKARLAKEMSGLDRQIGRSDELLQSEFVRKAPAPVVEKEHAKLSSLRESREKLAEHLAALQE